MTPRRALRVAVHFARYVLDRIERPPPVVLHIYPPNVTLTEAQSIDRMIAQRDGRSPHEEN